MASNQTAHYGLNQWAGTDKFIRTEFNEDNRKIDAALAELEGQKSAAVFGVYQGNNSLDRMIPLGFTPKAVLVIHDSGEIRRESQLRGGLALPGHPAIGGQVEAVSVMENGFRVRRGNLSNGTYFVDCNRSGDVYYYMAFH